MGKSRRATTLTPFSTAFVCQNHVTFTTARAERSAVTQSAETRCLCVPGRKRPRSSLLSLLRPGAGGTLSPQHRAQILPGPPAVRARIRGTSRKAATVLLLRPSRTCKQVTVAECHQGIGAQREPRGWQHPTQHAGQGRNVRFPEARALPLRKAAERGGCMRGTSLPASPALQKSPACSGAPQHPTGEDTSGSPGTRWSPTAAAEQQCPSSHPPSDRRAAAAGFAPALFTLPFLAAVCSVIPAALAVSGPSKASALAQCFPH